MATLADHPKSTTHMVTPSLLAAATAWVITQVTKDMSLLLPLSLVQISIYSMHSPPVSVSTLVLSDIVIIRIKEE
jgi:hypothetical protein